MYVLQCSIIGCYMTIKGITEQHLFKGIVENVNTLRFEARCLDFLQCSKSVNCFKAVNLILNHHFFHSLKKQTKPTTKTWFKHISFLKPDRIYVTWSSRISHMSALVQNVFFMWLWKEYIELSETENPMSTQPFVTNYLQ